MGKKNRRKTGSAKQKQVKRQGTMPAEKIEAEKIEAEKIETEKIETEGIEVEKIEAEKIQDEKEMPETARTEEEMQELKEMTEITFPEMGSPIKEKENQTEDQIGEPSSGAKKQFSGKKWLKYGAGAAVLLTAGVYIGGLVFFRDKFLPNTSVNGIDVSFCTVKEAKERVKREIEDYEIILKERGGKEERILGEKIGYHYVDHGEIEKFDKAQARALWFSHYLHPSEYQFTGETAFDAALLREAGKDLTCLKHTSQAPVNAKMVFRGKKFVVQKEKQGCKVKKSKFLELLENAVDACARSIDLEKEACYAAPTVTSEDQALNRLTENMNHYADIEITYCFGEQKEVLDGSVIKDWLIANADGSVTVREGAIQEYVAYLAEKYDTYNKPREFRTSDGSYVTVEGGSYGWMMDQEAEALKLTELMEQEPHMERIPEFAQTADSWENGDMGDSYVEVDLTKQHLWMYVDGKLIVDSDFVSGKMNSQRVTPPGTFRVYYKKSPAVLRSSRPGDSYESPVTFWMPFNGGIGFHDSSWRGSYGGEIYWNNGSHGCINLPYKAAEAIYQNIEKGFPVICFYRNGENNRI